MRRPCNITSWIFSPEQHALTVRMHDSYNINLFLGDFAGAHRIVEVVKYAGIEKLMNKAESRLVLLIILVYQYIPVDFYNILLYQ